MFQIHHGSQVDEKEFARDKLVTQVVRQLLIETYRRLVCPTNSPRPLSTLANDTRGYNPPESFIAEYYYPK